MESTAALQSRANQIRLEARGLCGSLQAPRNLWRATHGYLGVQREVRKIDPDNVRALQDKVVPELLCQRPALRYCNGREPEDNRGRNYHSGGPIPGVCALAESGVQQLTSTHKIGPPLGLESGESIGNPAVWAIKFHIVSGIPSGMRLVHG